MSDARESQRFVYAQRSVVSGDHAESSPRSKVNSSDEAESSEEQPQFCGDHGDDGARIRCAEPGKKNMRA